MEMKVLVAYSGGLDTSVIVKWVKETYNCEVVAYCADVGQEEETDGLDEKARKTGALKCIVDDLNEEFAQDFIFPMMQANAIYEGTYLLGTSIARPLIGKRLVEVAREEGCDAICHGATGKEMTRSVSNSQLMLSIPKSRSSPHGAIPTGHSRPVPK